MEEKRVLVIDEKLLRKIDENRGDLGREEFIDFCINFLIEHGESPPLPDLEKRVSQLERKSAELEEVKEKVGDIEEKVTSLERSQGTEFKIDEGKSSGNPEGGSFEKGESSGLLSEDLEKASFRRLNYFLWIPAILLYGVGDIITSALAYRGEAREANPLLGFILGKAGSFNAFTGIKIGIIIALMLISFLLLKEHHKWIIPALLCALGTYLVIFNLFAVL